MNTKYVLKKLQIVPMETESRLTNSHGFLYIFSFMNTSVKRLRPTLADAITARLSTTCIRLN